MNSINLPAMQAKASAVRGNHPATPTTTSEATGVAAKCKPTSALVDRGQTTSTIQETSSTLTK
jgi:hypothetical protein